MDSVSKVKNESGSSDEVKSKLERVSVLPATSQTDKPIVQRSKSTEDSLRVFK